MVNLIIYQEGTSFAIFDCSIRYQINFDEQTKIYYFVLQPKYICEHFKCYNPYENTLFSQFSLRTFLSICSIIIPFVIEFYMVMDIFIVHLTNALISVRYSGATFSVKEQLVIC